MQKISFISTFYLFPGFKLRFYHIHSYLTHIAASNTVINDVTNLVTHTTFNTITENTLVYF